MLVRKNKKNNNSKRKRNARTRLPTQKEGTVNLPPKTNGTVQIPRPMIQKQQIIKFMFKVIVQITSPAAPTDYYASFALYAPMKYYRTTGSSTWAVVSGQTAQLTEFMTLYNLYRVNRIQMIFQPIITPAVPNYPIIACMDVEYDITAKPTEQSIIQKANSTTLSSIYPAEITYRIPKPAFAAAVAQNTIQGGWLSTDSSTLSNVGSINVGMPVTTASTAYSRLEMVYEIWFKNQN